VAPPSAANMLKTPVPAPTSATTFPGESSISAFLYASILLMSESISSWIFDYPYPSKK
jgi:hypothetical protein